MPGGHLPKDKQINWCSKDEVQCHFINSSRYNFVIQKHPNKTKFNPLMDRPELCHAEVQEEKKQNNHLVGGFNQPNMENCDVSQNGNLNPPQNFRDENSKKYVSCHHLAMKNIQHLCDKGAQITQKQGSRSCMNVSDMISG